MVVLNKVSATLVHLQLFVSIQAVLLPLLLFSNQQRFLKFCRFSQIFLRFPSLSIILPSVKRIIAWRVVLSSIYLLTLIMWTMDQSTNLFVT